MSVSLEKAGEFASNEVFSTLKPRCHSGVFSRDIWRSMGRLGLLGMTVPERYGGSGGSPVELAEAVREFTMAGRDLGLSLSWITHLALCVKSIEDFGTGEQKERYLPRLMSGEWVGATAISEPGSGAHPGRIKTVATEHDAGFELTGHKAYVTDGPVADLIIVLAATGTDESRSELTAFLVETSSAGLEARPMYMDIVRTAPHGEIIMDGVQLGREAMLAPRGEGHTLVSRAAFARERSVVCAAICGLFTAAANEAAGRYRQKHEGLDLKGKDADSWIHHLSAIEVYRMVSRDLVDSAFGDIERWRRSIDLLIYLGLSYAKWGSWLGEFVADNQLDTSFPLDLMMNDARLVLVGEGLLLKEGRRRYIR